MCLHSSLNSVKPFTINFKGGYSDFLHNIEVSFGCRLYFVKFQNIRWTTLISLHFSLSYSFIKPMSHQSGVLTAFPQRLKIAERRGARCANASNGVQTLCNRLERHVAAFILSMLKTNAAAWRFHSVLIDSTLWQRCGVF